MMCEDCDHKHAGDCADCNMCANDKNCGHGMCCRAHGRRGCWGWFFKFFIGLLVLAAVFSAGMLVGAVKVMRYSESGLIGGPAGMMGLRGVINSGWNSMMGGARQGQISAFGTITKVEGNKITFTDNGNKEGVVLSMTGTTIISDGSVATLSEIKSGQTLSAYGNLNAKSELEATWIEVK